MKVLAVLNQKGGAGKTTLATHIARGLQIEGERVLLVDADPQGSARDWHASDEENPVPTVGIDRPTLHRDLPSLSKGYDWVVIDGAPQIAALSASAVKAADVVLIPVQPSPYDVWATSDLVEMIKTRQELTDGRLKAAFVISRQIPNTHLARDVEEALLAYELRVFESRTTQRVAYPQSASAGTTVLDVGAKKAADEIRAIVLELKGMF
jgi:chromosome partitioning protein